MFLNVKKRQQAKRTQKKSYLNINFPDSFSSKIFFYFLLLNVSYHKTFFFLSELIVSVKRRRKEREGIRNIFFCCSWDGVKFTFLLSFPLPHFAHQQWLVRTKKWLNFFVPSFVFHFTFFSSVFFSLYLHPKDEIFGSGIYWKFPFILSLVKFEWGNNYFVGWRQKNGICSFIRLLIKWKMDVRHC